MLLLYPLARVNYYLPLYRSSEGNSSKRSRDDDNSDDGAEDASELSVAARVTRVTTATPLQDFTAMVQQQPHNFLHSEFNMVLLQLVWAGWRIVVVGW